VQNRLTNEISDKLDKQNSTSFSPAPVCPNL